MHKDLSRRIFEEIRGKENYDEEGLGSEEPEEEPSRFAPDVNMMIKDSGESELADISLEKLNLAAAESGLNQLTDGEFALLDMDELRRGAEVEGEHTDHAWTAVVIAAHHLLEFPSYYDALEAMEAELTRSGSEKREMSVGPDSMGRGG